MQKEDFLSMSLEQSPIPLKNSLIKHFHVQQQLTLLNIILFYSSKNINIGDTVLHSNSSDISGQSCTRSHLSVIGMQVPSLHVKSFSYKNTKEIYLKKSSKVSFKLEDCNNYIYLPAS